MLSYNQYKFLKQVIWATWGRLYLNYSLILMQAFVIFSVQMCVIFNFKIVVGLRDPLQCFWGHFRFSMELISGEFLEHGSNQFRMVLELNLVNFSVKKLRRTRACSGSTKPDHSSRYIFWTVISCSGLFFDKASTFYQGFKPQFVSKIYLSVK